jgi:hypothetical protein
MIKFRFSVLISCLILGACAAPDGPTEGGTGTPRTAALAGRLCRPECIVAEGAALFASVAVERRDSVVTSLSLGFIELVGQQTDSVVVRLDAVLGDVVETDSMRIFVDGKRLASVTLRALQSGVTIFPFSAKKTVLLGMTRSRKVASRVGSGRLVVVSSAMKLRSSGDYTDLAAVGWRSGNAPFSCEIESASGQCGATAWAANPFQPGYAAGKFQSGLGTGVSTAINISFSVPVNSIRVVVYDPTFSGNAMTAAGPSGSQTVGFIHSGIPGLEGFSTDSRTVTGEFTSLTLTPGDGDYVAYSVYITIDKKGFVVKCEPEIVMRGGSVTCSAELSPARTFRVVKQTAETIRLLLTGKTFKLSQSPPNGDSSIEGGVARFVWSGTAAEGTTVRFEVSSTDSNGAPIKYQDTASFRVQPRDWSPFSLASADLRRELYTSPKHDQDMRQFPVLNTPLGLFDINAAPALSKPVTTVTDGPNQGLEFYTNPITQITPIIYMHPALTNAAPSQAWYVEQNGVGLVRNPNIFGQLVPRCGPVGVANATARLERHEGVSRDPIRSHWGIYEQGIRTEQLHLALERGVAPTDFSKGLLVAAYDYFQKKVQRTSPTGRANQQFDRSGPGTEYFLTFQEIIAESNCFFDLIEGN